MAASKEPYQTVAVVQPRSEEEPNQYAVGVRSMAAGSGWQIGSPGPGHLPVEKIYFTSGNKELELNLQDSTLTIADKSNLRVLVFPVDVSAMQGHVIGQNQEFTVVLGDEDHTQRQLKVNRWVAATTETFTKDKLPTEIKHADGIALSISNAVLEAERLGTKEVHTFGQDQEQTIDVTEQSAQQVVDVREAAEEVSVELTEEDIAQAQDALEDNGSVTVVLPDPSSGARYWASEWTKDESKETELTLQQLRAEQYRVVVLEMANDKSAVVALNDPRGLPVLSISKKPGKPPVERYLTEDTWNERFGPGTSLHFRVESDLAGGPVEERGDLSTPTIVRVTATKELMKEKSINGHKISDALAKHRRRSADRTDEYKKSLVRSGFGR